MDQMILILSNARILRLFSYQVIRFPKLNVIKLVSHLLDSQFESTYKWLIIISGVWSIWCTGCMHEGKFLHQVELQNQDVPDWSFVKQWKKKFFLKKFIKFYFSDFVCLIFLKKVFKIFFPDFMTLPLAAGWHLHACPRPYRPAALVPDRSTRHPAAGDQP